MTEFWRQRNVFVTGASGMLGSALTARLVERGANVTILLRDTVPSSELVRSGTMQKVNVVRGDLRQLDVIERTLHEYEIETVFHLGAQTIVGTANRHPVGTFESNIQGTWNVLEACRNAPLVKRIVVASSDKAYGDQKELPYKEDAPLQGRHPYDVSKSCTDLLAHTYHKTFGLPVAITRCGNLYGPGDLNFNRIVPGTIRSILNGERPVIRSDGKFVRDYFFIEDAVKAYMMIAGNLDREEVRGQAFNFSTEQPMDVIAMVKLVSQLMGSKLQPIIQNQASNEIRDQYLASGKARTMLRWKPSYTLEQGLKKTIPWYKKNLAGQARKR